MRLKFHSILFLMTFIIILIPGCSKYKVSQTTKSETTIQETTTAGDKVSKELTGNILLDAVPELADASSDMGGKRVTGQSETIKVKKSDFNELTDEQFTEFVKSHKADTVNDWYAILLDDETAVLFLNGNEVGSYGEWDKDLGIVKKFGTYKPDKDGIYRYEEVK